MTKTITIDGRDVAFRASAAVPRLYRIKFKRDIIKDMTEVKKAIDGGDELPVEMLTVFENVAYIMAKHADKSIPDTPDEWLDGFDTFSIYSIFPEIADLWADNMATLETTKKK